MELRDAFNAMRKIKGYSKRKKIIGHRLFKANVQYECTINETEEDKVNVFEPTCRAHTNR